MVPPGSELLGIELDRELWLEACKASALPVCCCYGLLAELRETAQKALESWGGCVSFYIEVPLAGSGYSWSVCGHWLGFDPFGSLGNAGGGRSCGRRMPPASPQDSQMGEPEAAKGLAPSPGARIALPPSQVAPGTTTGDRNRGSVSGETVR